MRVRNSCFILQINDPVSGPAADRQDAAEGPFGPDILAAHGAVHPVWNSIVMLEVVARRMAARRQADIRRLIHLVPTIEDGMHELDEAEFRAAQAWLWGPLVDQLEEDEREWETAIDHVVSLVRVARGYGN